jgi:hypothetical protein
VHSLHDQRNFICRSKQKRAVNPKNRGVIRNVFILQDMHTPILDVLVGDLRDGCRICHPANKQLRRQTHASLDRHREVGKHGECEGHEPDADVGLSQLQQLWNLPPLAHVVGYDH